MKPSETICPASVATMDELWPDAKSASAKSTAAAVRRDHMHESAAGASARRIRNEQGKRDARLPTFCTSRSYASKRLAGSADPVPPWKKVALERMRILRRKRVSQSAKPHLRRGLRGAGARTWS